jgi:D-serine deaminase-like pyridoxal phosphate-dependent protein
LTDAEAQDAVQETLFSVCKSMPDFKYNQEGSFKSWLLKLTSWRVTDQLRKRHRIVENDDHRTSTRTGMLESLPDPAVSLDSAWNEEWEANLMQVAIERPDAKMLLGKPLPATAAQHVIARAATAQDRIEWLIDTPARLQQYRDLARAARLPLKLNIEIDVGLHRGGVESTDELARMLALIRDEPLLRWSGFMGYDAHVTGIPDLSDARKKAADTARDRYAAMWRVAQQVLPAQAVREALTLNTGGSPTYHLHDHRGLPNEVAVGSAALKPADFDIPSLTELEPAVFIATPVLKDLGPFRLPEGASFISSLARSWDPNQDRALAIHGGDWNAVPVSPAGVAPSRLFGASSNQQVMVASAHVRLAPDDFVFFRPRHSEAVLLHFGDIAMVEHGRVVQMAPVFPVSA